MDHGRSEQGESMKSSLGAAGNDANRGSEDTSPDMLKNTPSNIRRLASEIEEIEGRHKYLAQTTSPSDGSDVRWYFSKVPLRLNELAASVPQTEYVGKGDYFRFGLRDSLAIEASFLQREEDLLCSWWKEYGECSEGPRGFKPVYNLQFEESSSKKAETAHLYAVDEERVGIPVKGGLYEVDLVKRHCFPVYWNGENRRVIRGHWFARKGSLDWVPLREDIAEQIEFAYRGKVWRRRTFQPSGLFAARVDLQGNAPGLHALFTGEDETWEAWLNAEASGFLNAIAGGGNGIKLRRGYAPSLLAKPTQDELRQHQEEEMDNYCSQVPVRHLVFMVHGIGQRLEKSNLVDDVADFHRLTADLGERHLTSYQRGTQRVLFIPCQWRKGLKLSGEHAVDKITLDGIRKLRVVLSATVHDVLYYMSPIYCQTVIDSVSNQLNRLYLKFLKRNPGYDGKVSIFGHSLGSVLSYDILCHQDTLISPFRNDWLFEKKDQDEQLSDSGIKSDFNLTSTMEDKSRNNADSTDKEKAVDAQEESSWSLPDPRSNDADGGTATDVDTPEESSWSLPDPCLNDGDGGTATDYDHGNAGDTSSSSPNVSEYDNKSERPSDERTASNADLSLEAEALNHRVGISEDDNEKIIKLLKEEIAFLKSKLNKIESNCEGKAKVHSDENDTAAESLLAGTSDTSKGYTPYIKYTKLEFKVDTFFAVGSPLGVFLALRNVRIGIGKGQNYWEEKGIIEEMPACQQMFNIFHPFDPVAYRIEPLVCKEHVNLRPVLIPYHRGGKRLYIKFQQLSEGLASQSQALKDHMSSLRVKVLTLCESKNKDGQDEGPEHAEGDEDRPYGSVMLEKLTGTKDGRIDHTLQDKTFRHPYLSALGSHTNYWRDADTALFILKHLYRDVPEEPPFIYEDSSNDGNKWKFWYEQRDEELPLTFADNIAVKDFLVKAKMYRKR